MEKSYKRLLKMIAEKGKVGYNFMEMPMQKRK